MSSQHINTEALRFKSAAFYNGLKSKVGLVAAKAAALLVNLNVQGCSIHSSIPNARSLSHSPSAPPPSFPQSPYPPRLVVRDERTHPHSPRLVVSHSTCPPLSSSPPANSFVIGPAVINTHTYHRSCSKRSDELVIPLPHVLGPKHERRKRPRNSDEFRIGEIQGRPSVMTSNMGDSHLPESLSGPCG